MPSTDQNCRFCGKLVKFNNMSRHVKRWHSQTSEGDNMTTTNHTPCSGRRAPSHQNTEHQSRRSSFSEPTPVLSPSADYIKDAVLCMLRRVEAINVPSLSTYLESHFPDIPKAWRMPVIVAAFTAVQKAAATHGDAVLNADEERALWAKKSLARWAHGLSAVEPGHAIKDPHHFRSRESSVSAEVRNSYSPTTNFLIDRDLPVPMDSVFEKEQFMADFLLQQEVHPDGLGSGGCNLRASLEVEPDDANGDLSDKHPGCQELSASATVSTLAATLPSVLVMPGIAPNAQTEEVLSVQVAVAQLPSEVSAPSVITPMVSSGTSSSVDKSTKMLGGVVGKGTSLNLLAGAPLSTSDTSEFAGQQVSMPETFTDLLKIHGVDATLWDELNRPLADCVSPLKTPIPATRHYDEPNVEEPALVVCVSPQSLLEEEPTVATIEARLADAIPREKEVPSSSGMRRKQKMASSSPTSKPDKAKSQRGREDSGRAGQMKVTEKENLKRTTDDDEQPLPECLDKSNSPKRSKVQPLQHKSIVTTNGNKRIPLKSNRKPNDDVSCSRNDRLPTPPLFYDRCGTGGQCRGDRDDSRMADRRRCQSDRHSYTAQSSRHDGRRGLTLEQRRWLAQMPRYWR